MMTRAEIELVALGEVGKLYVYDSVNPTRDPRQGLTLWKRWNLWKPSGTLSPCESLGEVQAGELMVYLGSLPSSHEFMAHASLHKVLVRDLVGWIQCSVSSLRRVEREEQVV